MTVFFAVRAYVFQVFLGAKDRPKRRDIKFFEGETGKITFKILDSQGNAVDNLDGVTASYKIAPMNNGPYPAPGAVATYTTGDGISIEENSLTVDLSIIDSLVAGNYKDQLTLTKDGQSLIASAGRIVIESDIE